MEVARYCLSKITSVDWSSIVALFGLFVTIVHFNRKQQDQLKVVERQIQSQREENKEQNLNNFQNSFWKKQLELYVLATSSAAELTQYETTSLEYKDSRTKFYTLFWGAMSIVEDLSVKGAMEAFSNQLIQYEESRSPIDLETLKQKSFQLARTCRESSIKRWGLKEFELK